MFPGVYSIDSCLKTVTLGSIASHYDLPVSWSVRCYQRALEIFLISANPHHPFVALLHDYLASSFFTCGRLSLSDSYFKRALRHLQKSLGIALAIFLLAHLCPYLI